MLKEMNQDNYKGGDNKPQDIKLANRDQEIIIGQDKEEEEENQNAQKDDTKRVDNDTL